MAAAVVFRRQCREIIGRAPNCTISSPNGITWFGPAYLAGALSFSNHRFTTNRSALGDQLIANFDGSGTLRYTW
jgi:hypothetical protein